MGKSLLKSQKLKQAVVLTLMFLIALGFMVPGFINAPLSNEDSGTYVEPRLCQTDADCYLTCDNVPLKVLCSQNLCFQNSCKEYSPYPFVENAVSFSLDVQADKTNVNLVTQPNNLFVTSESNTVKVHTYGLPLGVVLDRVGVSFINNCANIGTNSYCIPDWNITFLRNGNHSSLQSVALPTDSVKVLITKIES
jgi:hypothetical protein